MKCLLFLFLISFSAYSASQQAVNDWVLESGDISLQKLIDRYAKLKKKGISFSEDIDLSKMKVKIIGKVILNEQKLDQFVHYSFNRYKLSVIENQSLNLLNVISQKELRNVAAKTFTDLKDVPNSFAFVRFSFQLKYIPARDFSRNMRPFMSRYGRILEERSSHRIVIQDTGKNIHKMVGIMKSIDTPVYEERLKTIKKANRKIEKEEPFNWLDLLKSYHFLFIGAFFLIGISFGFGIRGYVMKKLESGW